MNNQTAKNINTITKQIEEILVRKRELNKLVQSLIKKRASLRARKRLFARIRKKTLVRLLADGVVEKRLGLVPNPRRCNRRTKWTLKECGDYYDVSSERIRQREAKAYRILRHPAYAKKREALRKRCALLPPALKLFEKKV